MGTIRMPRYRGNLSSIIIIAILKQLQGLNVHLIRNLQSLSLVLKVVLEHINLIVLTKNYLNCVDHLLNRRSEPILIFGIFFYLFLNVFLLIILICNVKVLGPSSLIVINGMISGENSGSVDYVLAQSREV